MTSAGPGSTAYPCLARHSRGGRRSRLVCLGSVLAAEGGRDGASYTPATGSTRGEVVLNALPGTQSTPGIASTAGSSLFQSSGAIVPQTGSAQGVRVARGALTATRREDADRAAAGRWRSAPERHTGSAATPGARSCHKSTRHRTRRRAAHPLPSTTNPILTRNIQHEPLSHAAAGRTVGPVSHRGLPARAGPRLRPADPYP